MLNRFLAVFILFLWTPIVTGQTIYYVSDQGSDSNPGTPLVPFGSVQHCVDQWDGVNQFICACEGEFHEEVVITQGGPSDQNPNRIIAWDTDSDGLRSDEFFRLNGENTRNVAISVPQGPKPANVELGYIQFKNYFPDNGCNGGGKMHFVEMLCKGGGGCPDWQIHHCLFDSLGVGCGGLESYIAIRPSNTPGLKVHNNHFRNIGGFVMRYIDGAGIEFTDNMVEVEVTGLKGWGENLDSMLIADNVFICDGNGNWNDTGQCLGSNAINFSNNAQYCVIRNNEFHDCISSISFGTSSNFGHRDNKGHLVEANYIFRTETTCNRYNAPLTISDCSNYSMHTGDSIEVRDIEIRNNVIYYYGQPDWYNQGAGIEVTSGHFHDFQNDIRIYNNSIRGFRWGLRLNQCLLTNAQGDTASYQMDGLDLKNNIFEKTREAQFTLNTTGQWLSGQSPQNFASDYNAFWGQNSFDWQGSKSFANWQSAGYDQNSIFCKPTYLDSNFLRLSPLDSCARNKGISLSSFNRDIDGQLRPPGAWDIGADEFIDPGMGLANRDTKLPVELFPNPFTNLLTLEVEREARLNITIWNANGHKIFEKDGVCGSLSLDTREWGSGLYIIQFQKRDVESASLKILKL